jgi:hypothetical protein
MKLTWIVRDREAFGMLPGDYFLQSWGVSRKERTGLWTVYDRRDARPYEGDEGILWTDRWKFATADELVAFLLDDWPRVDREVLLAAVQTWPTPARQAAETALASRT